MAVEDVNAIATAIRMFMSIKGVANSMYLTTAIVVEPRICLSSSGLDFLSKKGTAIERGIDRYRPLVESTGRDKAKAAIARGKKTLSLLVAHTTSTTMNGVSAIGVTLSKTRLNNNTTRYASTRIVNTPSILALIN